MLANFRRSFVSVLRKLASDLAPDHADFWHHRLRSDAHAARAFLSAARALQQEGRGAEADEVLARASGAFADDREILIAAAMSAHNAARYHEAILRWEAALAIAADHPMCHAGLSANLREIGQLERASTLIFTAVDRFPGDLSVVSEAARVASASGGDETALPLWAFAAGRPDAHPEWLHGYANALWRLNRIGEAREALVHARSKHPDDQALRQLETKLNMARASTG